MRTKGIMPSQITFGILLDACINENQVERAEEVFDTMKKEGCQMNTVLYTTLIKGFARAGQLVKAMGVYEDMCAQKLVPPDLITFSILIKANSDEGKMKEALDLVMAMKCQGLRPDEVIFNNLLGGCIKQGRVELAQSLYQDMLSNGVKPSSATFSILIRLYSSCKMLDEAVDMLRQEPNAQGVEIESRLYAQLAQCCLRQRQGRRAVEVYKALLEHSPATSSVHCSLIGMCTKLNMLDTGVEILSLAASTGGRVDSRTAQSLLEAVARKKRSLLEMVQAAMHQLRIPVDETSVAGDASLY
jgi:pentatricopeptide repeat protein